MQELLNTFNEPSFKHEKQFTTKQNLIKIK